MPSSDTTTVANTTVTVTLSREQAEHVRGTLLCWLEGDVNQNSNDLRTRGRRDDLRTMLDFCEKRLAMLESSDEEVSYADRRCELEGLADELMAFGIDQARDVSMTLGRSEDEDKDPGELAALRRGGLRKAETGAAIYDQIVREAGPAEVAA